MLENKAMFVLFVMFAFFEVYTDWKNLGDVSQKGGASNANFSANRYIPKTTEHYEHYVKSMT